MRPSPRDPALNEVLAIDFKFNAYGGIQKEDGSWWTKYGALYATDLKDARSGPVSIAASHSAVTCFCLAGVLVCSVAAVYAWVDKLAFEGVQSLPYMISSWPTEIEVLLDLV